MRNGEMWKDLAIERGDGILVLGAFSCNLSMLCHNLFVQVDMWSMKDMGIKNLGQKRLASLILQNHWIIFSFNLFDCQGGELFVMFESAFMIYIPDGN